MSDSIKNIIKNDFEKSQNLKLGEWKILFGKYKNKTYNEVPHFWGPVSISN